MKLKIRKERVWTWRIGEPRSIDRRRPISVCSCIGAGQWMGPRRTRREHQRRRGEKPTGSLQCMSRSKQEVGSRHSYQRSQSLISNRSTGSSLRGNKNLPLMSSAVADIPYHSTTTLPCSPLSFLRPYIDVRQMTPTRGFVHAYIPKYGKSILFVNRAIVIIIIYSRNVIQV